MAVSQSPFLGVSFCHFKFIRHREEWQMLNDIILVREAKVGWESDAVSLLSDLMKICISVLIATLNIEAFLYRKVITLNFLWMSLNKASRAHSLDSAWIDIPWGLGTCSLNKHQGRFLALIKPDLKTPVRQEPDPESELFTVAPCDIPLVLQFGGPPLSPNSSLALQIPCLMFTDTATSAPELCVHSWQTWKLSERLGLRASSGVTAHWELCYKVGGASCIFLLFGWLFILSRSFIWGSEFVLFAWVSKHLRFPKA